METSTTIAPSDWIVRIKLASENERAAERRYYESADPQRHQFDREWGDWSTAKMILRHTIDQAAELPEHACPCRSCRALFAELTPPLGAPEADWELRRRRLADSADAILAALREHGGSEVPQQVLLDAQLRDAEGLVDVALVESFAELRKRGIEVERTRDGLPVKQSYSFEPILYTITKEDEQ